MRVWRNCSLGRRLDILRARLLSAAIKKGADIKRGDQKGTPQNSQGSEPIPKALALANINDIDPVGDSAFRFAHGANINAGADDALLDQKCAGG